MVGVGPNGRDNMLARVSIVNSHGNVVYDKYVLPMEPIIDYRTKISGITPENLKNGRLPQHHWSVSSAEIIQVEMCCCFEHNFRIVTQLTVTYGFASGVALSVVQKEITEIFRDRIVVGHALQHDFKVLFLSHPSRLTRDTSLYK